MSDVTADTPAEAESRPSLDDAEVRALREAGRSWSRVPQAHGDSAQDDIVPDLQASREVRGQRLGDRRVRRLRHEGFDPVAPGVLQATARASEPRTGFGRYTNRLRRTLLGKPLATTAHEGERLTKKKALAVLSSDALSSVAYGPEAILAALVPAGAVAYGALVPVALAIGFLLFALILSYRQVIHEYPNAGGSYIVAKENLGTRYGLIAGAALVTDYVLTVAVSVASGVAAITSAYPSLTSYTVPICVGIIVLIVLSNLRGIRESASTFALPTYIFVGTMFAMIATVLYRVATGQPHAVSPPSTHATEAFGIFVVLKAYSSGCASLTGVEALSNSVGAFKPDAARNARTTLTVMGLLLGGMLLGTAVCARLLNLGIKSDETLLSQLATYAFGRGAVYTVLQWATFLILVLAANTSFTGFPRLFYFMARDGYVPRQFTRMGDRLAYSNGILVLGVLATVLVVVFKGQTDRLLPLYTIGVFLAFTMAQAGMVVRWRRLRRPGWRRGMVINAVGMVMTAVVFVITGGEKFAGGAWIVILLIPLLLLLFRAIHGHYQESTALQATETPTSPERLRPVCVVPIADLTPLALQSLAFARTISEKVVAVHVVYDQEDNEEAIARLRAKWEAWGEHVPLVIINSPYRSLVPPLLQYINDLERQRDDDTIVVVLPELVATRWWHQLLHNQTALRLKAALLFRPGTVVVSVPYHLRRVPRARRTSRARDRGLDDL